ncbi:MAG: hypothetical protein Q9201_003557 [Fulgogasparrea decipioides]
MNRNRNPSAGPRSYQQFTPQPNPHRPAPRTPSAPGRVGKGPAVIGGLLLGGIVSYYSYSLYKAFSAPDDGAPQDLDFSHRYNTTASRFDQDVEFSEWFIGITKLRRKLVQQARGNVLEAAVGTGRNTEFYNFSRIKSLTLLDQSKEMIEVAKSKWQETRPEDERCRWMVWSALDPLPSAAGTSEKQGGSGYDTIVATMSLCSVPGPSLFLRNLASQLSYQDVPAPTGSNASQVSDASAPSRLLLLEHGRSYYPLLNKLLDRTASAHAQKHGCWWNRDIGKIAEDSGLEIINIERKHFGTTWSLELGLPEDGKGQRRQQWLEGNRQRMEAMRRDVDKARREWEERMRDQIEAAQKDEELESWRRQRREQMRKPDA